MRRARIGYHQTSAACHACDVPPYRNLKAWQHAQRLAVECVKAARSFPEYEQAGLADQLRRASYSVPLSIAGGSVRRGGEENSHLLDAARGSLAEVETMLEIARDIGYIPPADYGRLEALATETSKMLYGLLRKLGESAGRHPRR
jgi:four helix bundle protein